MTRFQRAPLCAIAVIASLAACAPEDMTAAGDSVAPGGTLPIANAGLPAPAVEALGPVCNPADPAAVAQMGEQINAERVRLGKTPLGFADNLTFAAQSHACDMATTGQLGVAGSNGSSVVHRVRAVEYAACSSAQLIGRTAGAAAQTRAWMNVKADQEILVHQKFDEAGIGLVRSGGREWWSVVMADNCR